MAHRRSLSTTVVAALVLAGCSQLPSFSSQTAPPPPSAERLPPSPAPVYAPGDAFVFDDNGTVTREQVVSVAPDRVVWTNDQGLIWTKDGALVTPPLSWSDHPELGRGRQTIIGSPTQLFPLQEGNVIAYSVRGSSENTPTGWQDEHRCVVAGQQDVEVKAGDFSTFRIDCQRKDYLDTYYYAPVVQNYVLRVREFGDRTARKELVSVALANDRTDDMPSQVATPPTPVEGKPMEPPMPMAGAPGAMDPSTDGMQMTREASLVTRLENVVTRLETLAGIEHAGDAMKGAMEKSGDAAMKPASGGPWAVHLASYRSQKGARDGWKVLQTRFPSLQGHEMLTSEFDSGRGRGTFVRLLATGFASQESATDFCRPLVAKGQFCQAKGPLPG